MKPNARTLLLLPAALLPCVFFRPAAPAPPVPAPPTVPGDLPPVCATGCSAVPPQPAPAAAEIERALAALGSLPPAPGAEDALDTLLFHGRTALAYLDAHAPDLPADTLAELRRELARQTVQLEVRLVAADGGEPLRLPPTAFALGVKGHVLPRTRPSLQPPEISGTLHRVGPGHLWVRL